MTEKRKPAAVDLEALESRVTARVLAGLRESRPAANPRAAKPTEAPVGLSPEAIEELHDLYEETGDERLRDVLDEVCQDPDCAEDD